jgi:hypothetical protein
MADPRVEVQSLSPVHAAVLRYFEPAGPFAEAVAGATGSGAA